MVSELKKGVLSWNYLILNQTGYFIVILSSTKFIKILLSIESLSSIFLGIGIASISQKITQS